MFIMWPISSRVLPRAALSRSLSAPLVDPGTNGAAPLRRAAKHSTGDLVFPIAVAGREDERNRRVRGQFLMPGTGWHTLAGNVTQPIFEGFTLLNKQ
jgi:hypothetical protein